MCGMVGLSNIGDGCLLTYMSVNEVVVLRGSITCICTSLRSHSLSHYCAFLPSNPAVPCVVVERSVINLQMMSIYEKERKCLTFWVRELI